MTVPDRVDVLIIGAGPAGLSAAAQLARHGLDVHVLDRDADAGGVPRHCGHSPYGWREFRRVMSGRTYARKLAQRATDNGARIHLRATAVALHPHGAVDLSTSHGVQTVHARHVIIATGARETSRAARFIGGTKPGGVMNTGALQGLVYLAKAAPFKRPVVLGTELVSFSALLTCRHAGARPVAMIEPQDRVTTYAAAGWLPRALGIPLLFGTRIKAIHGADWVTGVTLESLGKSWDIACDGVVVTGAFRPENALLRASHLAVDPGTRGPVVDQFCRCSDPAYFAAGNVLRPVETAPWCWDEGRAVAEAVLAAAQDRLPDPALAQDIRSRSDAIAWHLPQRIVPVSPDAGCNDPALKHMQIALGRAARGQLNYDGIRKTIDTRPARRTLVPLPGQGTEIGLGEDS